MVSRKDFMNIWCSGENEMFEVNQFCQMHRLVDNKRVKIAMRKWCSGENEMFEVNQFCQMHRLVDNKRVKIAMRK